MNKNNMFSTISNNLKNNKLLIIVEKVLNNERINCDEGLTLFNEADLSLLGFLANFIREKHHGNKTFFNRNIHIEPTNICIYNCKFCSYSKKFNDESSWVLSIQEIEKIVENYKDKNISEIHIVGGVYPHYDLHYYGKMIKRIKNILPNIHIKAFTAVELDFMIRKTNLTISEGLQKLKDYGLDSIPGGGAEILDDEIRKQICSEKSKSSMWLEIHETAHKLGIPSTATMLYGHIENYQHRIEHLNKIRDLQDKTNGFKSFIPLKFRNKNNKLSHLNEVAATEDLKNYAISRIFLDNIPHIKAYWVMIGIDLAKIALSFGVDDIDGTIDDSTKIYSMAGVKNNQNSLTTDNLVQLIKSAKRKPVERNTLYNTIKEF